MSLKPTLAAVLILAAAAWSAVILHTAADEAATATQLVDYDGVEGQAYHEELYTKRKKCRHCHEEAEPEGYPEDGDCIRCHELEDIVPAMMPVADEDRWQNPHDSLHYGTDVPCVECHGEHEEKTPLCADCHRFEFERHDAEKSAPAEQSGSDVASDLSG